MARGRRYGNMGERVSRKGGSFPYLFSTLQCVVSSLLLLLLSDGLVEDQGGEEVAPLPAASRVTLHSG